MEKIIDLFIVLVKIAFRLGLAYGVCLLFTGEFNLLLWGTAAKVWLIVLVVLLLSQD